MYFLVSLVIALVVLDSFEWACLCFRVGDLVGQGAGRCCFFQFLFCEGPCWMVSALSSVEESQMGDSAVSMAIFHSGFNSLLLWGESFLNNCGFVGGVCIS